MAILPMAIATVVEETPGVLRYRILQTAPTALTIRLDPVSDADIEQVWPRVRRRLNEFLRTQGAATVSVELAPERPQPNPRNGKLRHVLRA